MVARGGGVVDLELRRVPRRKRRNERSYHYVLHVHVDVCESMGANCVTSVAEGMAKRVEQVLGVGVGLKIVSNLCDRREVEV